MGEINMPEWIKIITSKTSISVAFTVAWTVLFFVSALETGIYLVVLSFMIVFILFDPSKQFLSSFNKVTHFSKKLHQLSEPEKALLKRFIDEDRTTLKLRFTNNIPLAKLVEKDILEPSHILGFVSDGIEREEDHWSGYTINEQYRLTAKENYEIIFGAN